MAAHMINNCRISFPHLVQPSSMGAYGAQLMLNPKEHAEVLKAMEEDIATLKSTKLKGHNLPADKVCLDKENDRRPEYSGYRVLSAGQKPVVVGANGRDIVTNESDSRIYAGCLVHCKVELWPQDNRHGRRINAKLLAVQFAGDDAPLDGSYVPPEVAMQGFGEVTVSDSFLD